MLSAIRRTGPALPGTRLALRASLCAILLVLGSSSALTAQATRHGLPDAPGFLLQAAAAVQTSPAAQAEPTLGGTIVDTTGAAVPTASVTLVGRESENEKVIPAGAHGEFQFLGLKPGILRLTVVAPGMETYVSPEIKLTPGEHLILPEIVLPIEPFSSNVTVSATEEQVAQQQVKEQEQQRVLGVLPNFYTSYIWDAAPMNFRQKTQLAFRSTTDPVEFGVIAAVAGIEQERGTFKEYGPGPAGYGRRFGAAYGDVVFSRMIGSALLPALLHQDPRYFYLGSGTKKHRAAYAIAAAVICKGDSGHFQFNFSKILGAAAAGSISYAYHPGERNPSLIGRNVAIGVGGSVVTDLIREFLLRGVTSHVPGYKNGKPVAPKTK